MVLRRETPMLFCGLTVADHRSQLLAPMRIDSLFTDSTDSYLLFASTHQTSPCICIYTKPFPFNPA